MKTETANQVAKERRTPMPAMSARASKPESAPSVPQVVKRGTCATLNNKGGELAYEVGVDSGGDVQLRVVDNSGTGSFSDEWVGFRDIQAAFDRAPKSEPVSAYMLHPIFRGKSSNCCYFCAAVLKSEGLLRPSEKRKKRFDRVGPAEWLAGIRKAGEVKTVKVAGDTASKKPATRKSGAVKPKKSKKSAKS